MVHLFDIDRAAWFPFQPLFGFDRLINGVLAKRGCRRRCQNQKQKSIASLTLSIGPLVYYYVYSAPQQSSKQNKPPVCPGF